MMNIIKENKYKGILAVTIVAMAFLIPVSAHASEDMGLDSGYDLGDDSFLEATPNYQQDSGSYLEATPNYNKDNDSYLEATPNYQQDSGSYLEATPNYYQDSGSTYTPNETGYTYGTPSYANDTGYTYGGSPSYNYVPSSSYGCGSACSSGSSYVPYTSGGSNNYQYVPSTGSTAAPQWQYVSSTNTNKNTNTNTNTANSSATASNSNTITNNPVNVFNPTNNNDAHINLVVLGGGTTNGTNQTTNLSATCSISPSTTYVGQDVTFYANATGGNGAYTYQWSGSDGISASSQTFTGHFLSGGQKTATVTVTSNGQTVTQSCSAYVQAQQVITTPVTTSAYCVGTPGAGQTITWSASMPNTGYNYPYSYTWSGSDNLSGTGQSITRIYGSAGYKTATVTVYGNGQSFQATCNASIAGAIIQQPGVGTPVSGVYLNQVPDTGISFNLKMALFAIGLFIWSVFAAFFISSRRAKKAALATGTGVSFSGMSDTASKPLSTIKSKIEAFKEANMRKRGLLN